VTSFGYRAARADGTLVRGRLEAASALEAADLVSRRGLFPIAMEPADPAGARRTHSGSLRAQAIAMRSLASLVGAGLPLVAALGTTRNVVAGALGEALERAEARVREGSALATALDGEAIFGGVTIGLLRAGECGAGLAAALAQAADDLERRVETASRLRSALAYPAVLALVGGLSLLAIALFVVPRFAALLGDVETALPLSTRLLLGGSSLLRAHGPAVGSLLVLGAIGLGSWIARRRRRWHELLLDAPVVGVVRHAMASARGARALGALLAQGSPALDALRAASAAAGDEAVARRLASASEQVAQGAALSLALRSSGAFTPLTLQLAAIGDGVGRMPELLQRAADLETQFAEQRVRTLVAALEPALVLAFACLVAFVAAALLQAVYAVRPGTL
jgi:type II secretory pathway component PulF